MPNDVSSNETIAAIATASGRGAIGILRISGSCSEQILTKIFSASKKCKSHYLVHGNIIDPETHTIIDDVMLCIHHAPDSYTGEDVVEIFAHGGDINLHMLLELICRQGARLAHPGEFTRRSFINGKMDLTQAEGIEELISATDRNTHDLALKQIGGSFFNILKKWKAEILSIAAEYEVRLEYPEEKQGPAFFIDDKKQLRQVQHFLDILENKKKEKNGLDVVIVGRTNVGKSSLFNRLVKQDRVIVSDEHGTTRDAITEQIKIKNFSILLHDTAGIKEAESIAEKKALQITAKYLEKADLVLFILDSSSKKTAADDFLYEAICKYKKEYILCFNKSDLPQQMDESVIEKDINQITQLHFSTLTGEGVEHILDLIFKKYGNNNTFDFPAIYSPRYEYLLKNMKNILIEIGEMQMKGEAIDKIAMRIKDLLDYFDSFTGEKTEESILNTIFSRFCLGK